ncbi:hypothetical protein FOZ63_019582, partial [Perkinsus olseni]
NLRDEREENERICDQNGELKEENRKLRLTLNEMQRGSGWLFGGIWFRLDESFLQRFDYRGSEQLHRGAASPGISTISSSVYTGCILCIVIFAIRTPVLSGSGLEDFVSEEGLPRHNVFSRLYDDAVNRVRKLEALSKKIIQEEARLLNSVPCAVPHTKDLAPPSPTLGC